MQRLEPEQIENQTFPLSRRGYDKEKVDGFLGVVAAYYRDALRQAEARKQAPPPAPREPAPKEPFAQLGDRVAEVLSTATRTAEDITRTAEREAQRMTKTAATEAAETTQAANSQLAAARQVKTEADQQAEAILADARQEADRIKKDAHAVAARLEENGRERAARVEQAADGRVTAILTEARRRFNELRQTTQQSANHLRSVESMLRKAREQLTSDKLQVEIPDLVVEEAAPNGDQAAEPPHEVATSNGAPEAETQTHETQTHEMIAEVLEPPMPKRRKSPAKTPPAKPSGTAKPSGQNSVEQ